MEAKVVGNNVKKLMENNNMTLKELAKKMKIKDSILLKKLEGKSEFYVNEIIDIGKIFDLTVDEFAKIFFSDQDLSK